MGKVNKLLILALEFPPVNSTGCFRFLKFIRYLHESNVEVIVITPPVEDLIRIHPNATVDNSLLENIPDSLKIINIPLEKDAAYTSNVFTFKSRLKSYLQISGDILAKKWEANLYSELDEIIEQNKPDKMFVSLPPFSLGRLAVSISKKYSIPLITDFRDEWSLNKGIPFLTYLHFSKAFKSEEVILMESEFVTVVTPQLSNIFKRIHKNIEPEKLYVLTNGFDTELGQLNNFSSIPSENSDEFIIGYSGSYYYDPNAAFLSKQPFYKRKGFKKVSYQQSFTKEDWSYRSPLYFIKTLSELLKRRPDLRLVIKFHHIGHTPPWLFNMIGEYGLQDIFKSHGFVSKKKNMEIQKSFSALLCTSEKVINEEHYCLSSKVFDYVQMQKPILGFVTDGITKEFIRRSGCGLILDPENIVESSKTLESLITKEMQFKPDMVYLERFDPRNLTLKLASIIKE